MSIKSFRAVGIAGSVIREAASEAAIAYFETFPKSRKCDVTAGLKAGSFFTISYGRASAGEWPENYKNVTKKTAATIGK